MKRREAATLFHRATSGGATSAPGTPEPPNRPRHLPICSCLLLLSLLPTLPLLLTPLSQRLLSSPSPSPSLATITSPPVPSLPPPSAMRSLLLPPPVALAAPRKQAILSTPVRAPPSFPSPSRLGTAARSSPVSAMHRASSLSPSPAPAEEASQTSMAGKWAQKTIVVPAQRRGCHLITSRILREIEQDLSGFKCGLAHFFLQHTSASLTINENYDSDVQDDTETFLSRIVPEGRSAPWKHTLEGPDDMPAHIKSSMFGCALTVPITNGRLNMGTWQGIWLCEHRDHATPRKIVVTMNGM